MCFQSGIAIADDDSCGGFFYNIWTRFNSIAKQNLQMSKSRALEIAKIEDRAQRYSLSMDFLKSMENKENSLASQVAFINNLPIEQPAKGHDIDTFTYSEGYKYSEQRLLALNYFISKNEKTISLKSAYYIAKNMKGNHNSALFLAAYAVEKAIKFDSPDSLKNFVQIVRSYNPAEMESLLIYWAFNQEINNIKISDNFELSLGDFSYLSSTVSTKDQILSFINNPYSDPSFFWGSIYAYSHALKLDPFRKYKHNFTAGFHEYI